MTDEQIQQIRHWLSRYQDFRYSDAYEHDDRETQQRRYAIIETYFDDVPALLAEVERLWAENVRLQSMYEDKVFATGVTITALAEDRDRIQSNYNACSDNFRFAVSENELLQAQNDAMREIVRATADADVYHDSRGGMLIVSQPDQLVEKARQLLNERSNSNSK